MKLRAVRLMEVGLFSAGNALEGLSGGFDVLAGPNEMGKSTIFRANAYRSALLVLLTSTKIGMARIRRSGRTLSASPVCGSVQ